MRTPRSLGIVLALGLTAALSACTTTIAEGPFDRDGDGFDDQADCNDLIAGINPDAEEVLYDGIDNDCNPATTDADADGDGYPGAAEGLVAVDCDDVDPTVNPAAPEVCDELDNDCDGEVDEQTADATKWYEDADGDGYGNDLITVTSCEQPEIAGKSYTKNGGDCNDRDDDTFPNSAEICDGLDNDCDKLVDRADPDFNEALTGTWYFDGDGDGFGVSSDTVKACEQPTNYVQSDTDCDDDSPFAYPGAPETCNGLDDNCNGEVDEEGALGGAAWFRDADGDGFGDPNQTDASCEQPEGYVADSTDCDDLRADVSPGAVEICNLEDDDCDGRVDDEDTDVDADTYLTFFADADSDGFGDASNTIGACELPSGYVANDTDCDDNENSTYPGADEFCDEVDSDCDGTLAEDDSLDAPTWYFDADEDDYGRTSMTTVACSQPVGYVDNDDDCNDVNKRINPDGNEVCNGLDDDCDSDVDDDDATIDATTFTTFYADTDGDGFGDEDVTRGACEVPSGYVVLALATDCDDGDDATYPGATESCNAVDDDCDGATDEAGSTGEDTWYFDGDGDGYGRSNRTTASCNQPAGFVDNDDDCDDIRASINPDGTEVCNGRDDDCDSDIDDDDSDVDEDSLSTWYLDDDDDGFGDPDTTEEACEAPTGYLADDSDCDDGDDAIYPGAEETCDGVDEDCDGVEDNDATDGDTFYFDADGDSFGGAITTVACEAPSGYVDNDDDCNDSRRSMNPDADEFCDSVDNDCDGDVDEDDAVDAEEWFEDADEDGFGLATSSETQCTRPTGYVLDDSDCDDDDETIHPDAHEVCDAIDNDCDEVVNFGFDVPDDYTSIQDAIDDAADGDVICVEEDTYTERIDFRGRDVTVAGYIGDEVILDGDGKGPILRVDSGESADATLRNITLTNGSAQQGAAIYLFRSAITLDGVTLDDIRCGDRQNVQSVGDCYGVVFLDEPTEDLEWTDVTATDLVLNGNNHHYGGFVWQDRGSLSIDGLEIDGVEHTNRYNVYGGVFDMQNGADLTLNDASINDVRVAFRDTNYNASNVYGGVFRLNSTNPSSGTDSSILDLTDGEISNIEITHNDFGDNWSYYTYGGISYANSYSTVWMNDVSIDTVEFNRNSSYTGRQLHYLYGGLFSGQSYSEYDLDGLDITAVSHNYDYFAGNRYRMYHYGGLVRGESQSRWSIENTTIDSVDFSGGYWAEQGGLMYFTTGRRVDLYNVTIEDSTVETASNIYGGFIELRNNTPLTLDTVEFKDNVIKTTQGIIYGAMVDNYNDSTTRDNHVMRDVTVTGNEVTSYNRLHGGFAMWYYTNVDRRNMTFNDNVVESTNEDIHGGFEWIYASTSDRFYDRNFTAIGNEFEAHDDIEGGIWRQIYTTQSVDNAIVLGNQFTARLHIYGGYNWLHGTAYFTMNHNTVHGNRFTPGRDISNGGGYYVYGGVVYFANSSGYAYFQNSSYTDNKKTKGNVRGMVADTRNVTNYTYFRYSNFYGNEGTGSIAYYQVRWGAGIDPQTTDYSSANLYNVKNAGSYTDISGTDPFAWDVTLKSTSALIDEGNAAYLGDDADFTSPNTKTPDIGAYGGPYNDEW